MDNTCHNIVQHISWLSFSSQFPEYLSNHEALFSEFFLDDSKLLSVSKLVNAKINPKKILIKGILLKESEG
jgi:hypothetical protein